MKTAIKKEVITGIIISFIIFCICFALAIGDRGPCTGGIGIIMDFFILTAAILFFGILMFVHQPAIALTAKTVVIALLIGSVLLFVWLINN